MTSATAGRRRRAVTQLVVGAGAASLLLAGCSSSTPPAATVGAPATSAAAAPVAGSATSPSASGSAAPSTDPSGQPSLQPSSGSSTVGSALPPGTLTEVMKAAMLAKGSATVTMSTAGVTIATGVLRINPHGIDMRLALKVGTLRLQEVLVNNVFYMKFPTSMVGELGGKPWLKVSATGKDPLSKQLAPLLKQFSKNTDLSKNTAVLNPLSVAPSGTELIDGVEALKYVYPIDSKRMQAEIKKELKLAPPAVAKAAAAQIVGATGSITIFVDREGLTRRIVTYLKPKSGKASTTTVAYQNWGEPVIIAAPPASQVGRLPAGH